MTLKCTICGKTTHVMLPDLSADKTTELEKTFATAICPACQKKSSFNHCGTCGIPINTGMLDAIGSCVKCFEASKLSLDPNSHWDNVKSDWNKAIIKGMAEAEQKMLSQEFKPLPPLTEYHMPAVPSTIFKLPPDAFDPDKTDLDEIKAMMANQMKKMEEENLVAMFAPPLFEAHPPKCCDVASCWCHESQWYQNQASE